MISEYFVGRVTAVDMENMKILVEDRFGTNHQVSLNVLDPLLSIPKLGDGWLIRRAGDLGIDWFLDKRAEDGTELTPLSSLQPGDRRIEGTTLYLDSSEKVFAVNSSKEIGQEIGQISIAPTAITAKSIYVNEIEPVGENQTIGQLSIKPTGITMEVQQDQVAGGAIGQLSITPNSIVIEVGGGQLSITPNSVVFTGSDGTFTQIAPQQNH